MGTRDSNEGYPKVRNHGEGPYSTMTFFSLKGAFSVITNLRMDLFEALVGTVIIKPSDR